MNIHFMTSLFGNTGDYARIAGVLESEGHRLVTRHYLERTIDDLEKELPSETELFYNKVLQWINDADFVIFEVSTPCVEVGYDLAQSLNKAKPVLVLYKEMTGVVPYGLKGLHHEKLLVAAYTDKNLTQVLQQALVWASEHANIRFSFPLSGDLAEFLDTAARKKQISRSTFLQLLLEREKHTQES